MITVSAPTHTHAKPKLNPSPLASSRLYALRRISQHPPTYVLSTYAGRVVSSSCIMVGRRYIFQETTYVHTYFRYFYRSPSSHRHRNMCHVCRTTNSEFTLGSTRCDAATYVTAHVCVRLRSFYVTDAEEDTWYSKYYMISRHSIASTLCDRLILFY